MVRLLGSVVSSLATTILAPAQAPPSAPADAAKSVVKVVATPADGESRTACGVVMTGGGVLTTTGFLEKAASVRILTSKGEERVAAGVAAFDLEANVALLAVHWDEPPPGQPVAAETPVAGAEVAIIRPGGAPIAGTVGTERDPSEFGFTCAELVTAELGGAPLIKDGQVVGIVSGRRVAFGPDGAPEVSVFAARPERLRALQPGALVQWKDWPARQEAWQRADKIATDALASEDKDECLRLARDAVLLEPSSWRAWAALGRAHLKNGNDAECLASMERVIALSPAQSKPYMAKSGILAQRGHEAEAIAAGRRAVELSPDAWDTHRTLGYALYRAGLLEEAVAEYRRAVELKGPAEMEQNLRRIEEHLRNETAEERKERLGR